MSSCYKPEMDQSASRFLRLACDDISSAVTTPEATDERMPGVLERRSLLSMTHLWDRHTWRAHKSEWRWVTLLRHWPRSSILHAIRVPFLIIGLLTTGLLVLNRLLLGVRLTLPLAPLSLQAASIGLLLVFRNNQTHDRLKEAQRALGGMGPLAREVMHLLVVHAKPTRAHDVGHAARLLALFGFALKAQCRDEPDQLEPIARVLLPRAHAWLLRSADRPAAVLLRLRAVVGDLQKDKSLSSDAFKFVEERLAKLSAVDATCVRLSTFPVPPSYHRHGSRAILVWLGSLPFVLEGIGCHPLQTIFSLLCTTWLLLGIDQIAIEVEQPLDVLPLHVFATGMPNDVARALESWHAAPPLTLTLTLTPTPTLTLTEVWPTTSFACSSRGGRCLPFVTAQRATLSTAAPPRTARPSHAWIATPSAACPVWACRARPRRTARRRARTAGRWSTPLTSTPAPSAITRARSTTASLTTVACAPDLDWTLTHPPHQL